MSQTTLERAPRRHLYEAGEVSAARLLEVDPDLGRFLTPPQYRAASALVVPVRTVSSNDADVSALVKDAQAFGVLVVDGMLVYHVQIADRRTLRLLGPGDMFWVGGERSTTVLAESRCCGTATTKLALLGDSILIAARRFPRLLVGLMTRVAEQSEREAAHLAINQLPRVEQRLLAIMWLLAEKWGYVTRAGTVVPLALTHETLGALIGARRPTVTLALAVLSERGELLKQERGWLITPQAPAAEALSTEADETALTRAGTNGSHRRVASVSM